jgi:hypothetical protein
MPSDGTSILCFSLGKFESKTRNFLEIVGAVQLGHLALKIGQYF